MDNVAGSLGAAPIWRNMMGHYLMGKPVEEFEKPTFVVSEPICLNGRPTSTKEFFIAGTQPPSCDTPTERPTETPQPSEQPTPTSQTDSDQNDNQDNSPTPTLLPTTTPIATPTSGAGPATTTIPTVQILNP